MPRCLVRYLNRQMYNIMEIFRQLDVERETFKLLDALSDM